MANPSAEWPVGWIVNNDTEFNFATSIFNLNYTLHKGIGNEDNFDWAVTYIAGKKVFLVNAPQEYHAMVGTAMRERFNIQVLFFGGTCDSDTYGIPPIGHCLLQLPDVDESQIARLSTIIPGENMASLAKLANAIDRFVAKSRTGEINIDATINELAVLNPEINDGLVQPEIRLPPDYRLWPRSMNNYMCCSKDLNSGRYRNQIPCLRVRGVRGYKRTTNNHIMWVKFASLASAVGISAIIGEIYTGQP
ncbi:hypothetical protein ACSS6W_000564 [Trichoderma asperelloides]|nr:hypothetical protein LI328DRAFT_161489 [Trichoderma asperelloides]